MKLDINSVEVHPQLSNKGHPVDGALVGAGSLWPSKCRAGLNLIPGPLPYPRPPTLAEVPSKSVGNFSEYFHSPGA